MSFGRLVSIVRENVSLAATGIVLIAFASKMLIVSGNSPTTAFVILTRTGPFNALFGSLLLLFPIFVLIVTTIGFIELSKIAIWRTMHWPGRVLVTWLMVFPTLLLVPWFWTVIYAVTFLLLVVAHRVAGPSRQFPLSLNAVAVTLFVAYAAYGTLLSSSLWLPTERIELSSGEALIAYELSRDSTDLILLQDEDRKVLRIPLDQIAARSYCRPRSLRAERSILALAGIWVKNPDYESC